MPFGGPFGDEKALGYLLVGESRGDHGDHLALPAAQRTGLCHGRRRILFQRVGERAIRAHRQAFIPRPVGLALAELGPCLAARLLELTQPGRPRAQRPFARHAVDHGAKAQRTLRVAARD